MATRRLVEKAMIASGLSRFLPGTLLGMFALFGVLLALDVPQHTSWMLWYWLRGGKSAEVIGCFLNMGVLQMESMNLQQGNIQKLFLRFG